MLNRRINKYVFYVIANFINTVLIFFRPSTSIQSFVLGLRQLPLPPFQQELQTFFPVSQISLDTLYGLSPVDLFPSLTEKIEATRNASFGCLYSPVHFSHS